MRLKSLILIFFAISCGEFYKMATPPEEPELRLISASPDGTPASTGTSYTQGVSGNGKYVVFISNHPILPIHTNSAYQLYRYDVEAKNIELVSTNANGDLADPTLSGIALGADHHTISYDGKCVAFKTTASNLHPDMSANTQRNIVHKNLETGVVTIVSADSSGTLGDGNQHNLPKISPDGNYVFFQGNSTNLVPGVSGSQLYKKNIATEAIEVVSSDASNTAGTPGGSWDHNSSLDGTRAVFTTNSSNWAASAGTPGYYGVYLKNLTTGDLELASKDDQGNAVHVDHYRAVSILQDNKTVAFKTALTVMSTYPNNGKEQVYLRDTVSNSFQVLSTNHAGVLADDSIDGYALTPDGKYFVFSTKATNMLEGKVVTSLLRIYRKNLETGLIEIVSADKDGQMNNSSDAIFGSVSQDGKWISFSSTENFMGQNTPGIYQVFLKYLP